MKCAIRIAENAHSTAARDHTNDTTDRCPTRGLIFYTSNLPSCAPWRPGRLIPPHDLEIAHTTRSSASEKGSNHLLTHMCAEHHASKITREGWRCRTQAHTPQTQTAKDASAQTSHTAKAPMLRGLSQLNPPCTDVVDRVALSPVATVSVWCVSVCR